MKATYSLSHSLIAAAHPSTIDLIINFGADNETDNQITRRPLNLSLVIDRSGSMAGKSLLKCLLQTGVSLINLESAVNFNFPKTC
ncbi:hypothetical protein [Limnofasciculus baicalensis]|uniref:Uncharacterized protein n=1 Tax=Limnofasciculus baicalensis BBK-W-15 TaxID=2699891 RepID=A0AAE3GXM3_9CYAN|nr:hypothetical protein [Limnofasciculus baicalensis]MCP2731718.1 hypothetical protein [Limnofasciculus baicalensis BBK-W-15]